MVVGKITRRPSKQHFLSITYKVISEHNWLILISYLMYVLVQLTLEDIDSDTKRHQLFETLLSESLSLSQLLCLGTLLQIWPVLAATELK